jgi:hypothetical protein
MRCHVLSFVKFELNGSKSKLRPISMAVWFKAYFYGGSISGIAGQNPAEDMDVLQLCLLCVVQVSASAKS